MKLRITKLYNALSAGSQLNKNTYVAEFDNGERRLCTMSHDGSTLEVHRKLGVKEWEDELYETPSYEYTVFKLDKLIEEFNAKQVEKPTFAELRTLSGMTQAQFSEHFNIPKRTIENWESGVRTPPDYVLELIEYNLRKENIIK